MAKVSLPIKEIYKWFKTPPGQYLLNWEHNQFNIVITNIFGYQAWQIGFGEHSFLDSNKIPFKGCLGTEFPLPEIIKRWQVYVVSELENMPFKSQSLDLLVLPHIFEWSNDPYAVLCEAWRSLVPGGRLIISGFNPWSLWGLYNCISCILNLENSLPIKQISFRKLKNWLELLSFNIDSKYFGCYIPFCLTEKWIKRWYLFESVGSRLWYWGGAIYIISAIKHITNTSLITPIYKSKHKIYKEPLLQ